ncbi:MAG: type II toxin-antitoxin system HicB family antitoxin [Candidatus Gastranaerophilales bacterium]|nr:type II toxin-antitoxin system HicB family antitoxin [Candidatus Gastranaerophilales bacterium]
MNKDLNYYLNLPWTYHIEWSNEDSCYVISIAELKGCKTEGGTLEEAVQMIADALHSHLSGCIEAGIEIPEPLKPVDYKGKIPYRTTSENHYKIAKRAKSLGISINAFIDGAVKEKLESA